MWGVAFGAAEVSRWCLAVLLGKLVCRDRAIVGYVVSGLSYVVSGLSCGCSICYWFGYCCIHYCVVHAKGVSCVRVWQFLGPFLWRLLTVRVFVRLERISGVLGL